MRSTLRALTAQMPIPSRASTILAQAKSEASGGLAPAEPNLGLAGAEERLFDLQLDLGQVPFTPVRSADGSRPATR